MQSPFPGMDPYIEARGLWGDFHWDIIADIKRALVAVAPDRYLVRTSERSYVVLVEEEGKESHPFLPDVSVAEPRSRRPSKKKGQTAVAELSVVPEPVTMRAFITEEHREAFIEILEADADQRLITGIEVLSPSNKRPGSPGWDLYQRKRHRVMLGGANLVEIDLLRGGHRMPMLDPWPDAPYVLLVARAYREQSCRVWPATLQQRLPAIPVPLAKPDADLTLDLQPIIESIYERSRYARSIDYRKPLKPALTSAESAWLRQQLKNRS
jgi:hypothetical protein